jgi:hypothetical protein
MTDFEHEHEVPVTEYGAWRREQARAQQRANAELFMEMLNGGGQDQHRADHDRVTRSTHGLFGAMTPEDHGQANAERQAVLGSDFGQGRPLERNGGMFDWSAFSDSPAPARVYASQINDRPGLQGDGVSPVVRYLQGRQ